VCLCHAERQGESCAMTVCVRGPYVIQVAAALLYAGVCSHGIIMEHRGHVIR